MCIHNRSNFRFGGAFFDDVMSNIIRVVNFQIQVTKLMFKSVTELVRNLSLVIIFLKETICQSHTTLESRIDKSVRLLFFKITIDALISTY